MARRNRQYCDSGYYHIITRGVNRQEIFHDDMDRLKYSDTLRRFSIELEVDVLAYCLMDNHVHLLVHAGDALPVLIKKIASSYVYYFNHKYDRIGHLFQDRYHSKAIEDDSYLLAAARYILRNPQKAGVCAAQEYQWSSWQELESGAGLCKPQLLCEIVGGTQALKAYILAEDENDNADDRGAPKDASALNILRRISGLENPEDIAKLPKQKRVAVIIEAKKAGLTVRQLSRLTGLNRNTIQRI